MRRSESPWEVEAPDNAQYPRGENGENFIYFLATTPFRLIAAPFRFVIGIVSAKTMDEEIAKRGVLDGEENLDMVNEVIQEYGQRFFRGGRRRKS